MLQLAFESIFTNKVEEHDKISNVQNRVADLALVAEESETAILKMSEGKRSFDFSISKPWNVRPLLQIKVYAYHL
jgi:hypothetical protein